MIIVVLPVERKANNTGSTYDWALLLPLALPPDLPPVILIDLGDEKGEIEWEGAFEMWIGDERWRPVVSRGRRWMEGGGRKEEAEGPLGIK